MESLKLSNFISTKITIKGFNFKNQLLFYREFANTITYNGVDKMANAILGTSMNTRITHLYAYFTSLGNVGISGNFEGGDPKNANRSSFITGANNGNPGTIFGALWIPVASTTEMLGSDENYQNNIIKYTGIIPSSIAADDNSKIGEFVADSSEIRAIGLAIANNYNDRSEDTIFSVIDIPETENVLDRQPGESFIIPSNGQVTIDYSLTLLA